MKIERITFVPLFFAMIVVSQTACTIVQKIIDPVKKERKEIVTRYYEKDGLSFLYPDNWQVTEDAPIENDIRHVNVEDSDSSLFILNIMASEFEVDLDAHATTFMKELPANLPVGKIIKVESERTSRVISNQAFEGVRRKYSISVLGEVVPHTVDFFLVAGEKTNALVMIQSPDEDWKAAEKEVKIISDSLKLE